MEVRLNDSLRPQLEQMESEKKMFVSKVEAERKQWMQSVLNSQKELEAELKQQHAVEVSIYPSKANRRRGGGTYPA